MSKLKSILVLFLFSAGALAQAPVWFSPSPPIPEFASITASKGMTFRIGQFASTYAIDVTINASVIHHEGDPSAEAWTAPMTLASDSTFVASTAYFASNDPLFGVVKQVQVLETASSQTFTYAAGGSTVTVVVPALASSAVASKACSAGSSSCTNATTSDAASIITTTGSVSLNPTETATLKAAIMALQTAQAQVVTAQAALQAVQQAIAANHGASANGPYQINTDFNTTIEQVPPVPALAAQ